MQTYGIEGAYFQYTSGNPTVRGVDFLMRRGEVHGLVGENGAGKSTLIDLLTGNLAPQRGTVVADGAVLVLHSLREAQNIGIAVVQQHYNVFPEMSVVDNIMCLGRRVPRSGLLRHLDRRSAVREVAGLLSALEIDIDPESKVRTLDAAGRKMIEVARAVRQEPSFLVLDEPTAALEPSSSRVILDLLGRLRDRGLGLCFVSHRLDEVLSAADRVTVLRNGSRVACMEVKQLSLPQLATLIVGRDDELANGTEVLARRPRPAEEPPALTLRAVRVAVGARSVDLDVAKGEIIGLVGLLGSGTSRLVRMVGGAEPMVGAAFVNGRVVAIRGPRDAQKAGIGFIPENRKEEGFLPDLSVLLNLIIAKLSTVRMFNRIRTERSMASAQDFARRLDVRIPSLSMPARALSGGNLQKMLIAKWLTSGMTMLAIDEPTHGVDIGGKERIHSILRNYVADGGTVIVSLSESQEAMQLCDRVAVMRHGEVVAIVAPEALTRGELAGLGATSGAEAIEALLDGATAWSVIHQGGS